MTRVTKDPEERKQEILEGAMKLFYEKGYDKTSITDIAKSIGIAQGLCYRYFSSKEEMFETAVNDYAQIIADKMISQIIGSEKSLKQIILKGPTFAEVETDDNLYYKLFHNKKSGKIHDQLSVKVCEKLMPVVEKLIQKAVDDKEIKEMDPKTAASFCVYGQLGILLDSTLGSEEKIIKIREFFINIFNM